MHNRFLGEDRGEFSTARGVKGGFRGEGHSKGLMKKRSGGGEGRAGCHFWKEWERDSVG